MMTQSRSTSNEHTLIKSQETIVTFLRAALLSLAAAAAAPASADVFPLFNYSARIQSATLKHLQVARRKRSV